MSLFNSSPRRRGAAGSQYALIVGLVGVVALLAITSTGASVREMLTRTSNAMNDASNSSSASAGSGATTSANCTPVRTSCAAHLAAGCTTSGAYSIQPQAAVITAYCDMTSDGGGWTLAYKNLNETGIQTANTAAQGNATCLTHTANDCSAKMSDAMINALTGSNASGPDTIAYRVSSPNIANTYYFSRRCVYAHSSHADGNCEKYLPAYTSSTTPAFLGCNNWGGGGGGLNAWYQCNGAGGYSNIAVTHRNYTVTAGITTNSAGVNLGGSNTSYSNSIWFWVR